MKKAAVIEKSHAPHWPSSLQPSKFTRSQVHDGKEEESYRRVIYGFFERNSAASGAESKWFPG